MSSELFEYTHEPYVCKEFGCGKILTLRESLLGDRCVEHPKEEKIDITYIINAKK